MDRGMTLIEILIVIGIISFLSVLSILIFRTQIFKSQDAKRKADLRVLATALEEYQSDNYCYPITVTCLTPDSLDPYISEIPCDPETDEPYDYQADPSACPSWWRLTATPTVAEDPIVLESPNAPLQQ